METSLINTQHIFNLPDLSDIDSFLQFVELTKKKKLKI